MTQTLLSLAAGNGYEMVVEMLVVRDDIDADSKDGDGRTPLLWAVEIGHKAVVEILVARDDVDVDLKDRWEWTPLSQVAGSGHDTVVEVLAKRWWKNWRRGTTLTPTRKIMLAVTRHYRGRPRNGHKAVVELLAVRDDVGVDSKDNDTQTPLWWAARNGHEGVVKLLELYNGRH
jgi:ankyrin repeat protein